MNKIEYGEGCFGPYVSIDGQSIFEHEYSDDDQKELINKYRRELLDNFLKLSEGFDMNDWKAIAEIVVSRGRWKYEEDKEYNDECDQCGNYNWGQTYTK